MSKLPGLFKIKASYKPTAEIETFVGEQGELFYSEGDTRLRISDGETPGGIVVNADNISDVSGFTIDDENQTVYLNSNWDLLPTDNDSQSLGSPENRWKDLYVSGGTIYLGDGIKIQVETSTGSISLPSNTVLRDDDTGDLESIVKRNEVVSLKNQIAVLASGGAGDTTNLSSIEYAEVSLSGTEFTLNFNSYSINDLIDFRVLDSNNETVEVVSIIESNRLILQSNVNLENHTIRLVYQ